MNLKNKEENHKEITELEMDFNQQLYEKYGEIINTCSNTINITNLIGIFSFLGFLVLLNIRTAYSFSWFFLLIPAYMCVFSFIINLNTYLKLNDIIEEAQQHADQEVSKIGSILSYFCLNSVSLCIVIYLLLVSLQIEEVIVSSWNLIAIPIYLSLGILTFYWIFILPAFLHNRLYWETSLTLVYLICSFVFTSMLNFKLDKTYSGGFINISASLLFALGYNFIYITIQAFYTQKLQLSGKLSSIAFLAISIVSLVLLGLKADGILLSMHYWVPVFIFTLGLFIFLIEKILELTLGENSSETVETKEEKL